MTLFNVFPELGQRPPAFSATALPTLITGLSSRHRQVRYWSASLLRTLGPDACPAVPDLIKTFWEPIDLTRRGEHPMAWDPAWAAGFALLKIAPGTASAGEVIQALTEVLQTGHPARRNSAANFLGQFGPAAIAAVPVLVKVLSDNAATKPGLWDGADAATALGEIAPGTPVADKAVAALTAALGAESEYTRAQAIKALTKFGPQAMSSIPRLRALVNDPHAAVRSAAARALDSLGSNQ